MRDCLSLIIASSFFLSGSAAAGDYYITVFQGDYEVIYAVSPSSIVDLGEGVKQADLLAVDIDRIEIEKDFVATIGSLGVMVIEVKCASSPREFKEDSEYVQFSETDDRIDKTAINPYKDWTPIPTDSSFSLNADFICGWPQINPDAGLVKLSAESNWDFVDTVVDTVRDIKDK